MGLEYEISPTSERPDLADVQAQRRQLEVALRDLGYGGGAKDFLERYQADQPLHMVVDFVESAVNGGFPIGHVTAVFSTRVDEVL